jgi:hypothetical protein
LAKDPRFPVNAIDDVSLGILSGVEHLLPLHEIVNVFNVRGDFPVVDRALHVELDTLRTTESP